MTVFDPTALRRLVDDTDDQPFVFGLVRTYQRMLAPRVERLVGALARSDVDDALDAVLSLKVSSTMTGAPELAELAREVETSLRQGRLACARATAGLLAAAARSFDVALDDYLARTA